MIGYVARDKSGELYVYSDKPNYDEDCGVWYGPEYIGVALIEDIAKEFEDLSYTDELIKVEINIKRI